MKTKRLLFSGLGAVSLLAVSVIAFAGNGPRSTFAHGLNNTLAENVHAATEGFTNVDAATGAGYEMLYGCVSGPEQGAMGIHFVKSNLVDGVVDVTQPEALLYEFKDGQLKLTGAEYVVVAAPWDTANAGPPVLSGQVFDYTASPNRYRIPAVYTLHVWAQKQNPKGTFADWNPNVSCDDFTGR